MTPLVRAAALAILGLVGIAACAWFGAGSLGEARAISHGPCAETTEGPCLTQTTATLRRVRTKGSQTFWTAPGFDQVRMVRSEALRLGLVESGTKVELEAYETHIIEVRRGVERFRVPTVGWDRVYLATVVALGLLALTGTGLAGVLTNAIHPRMEYLLTGWCLGLAVGWVLVFAGVALVPAAIVGAVAVVLGLAVGATYPIKKRR